MLPQDGKLIYLPGFLSPEEAKTSFDNLHSSIKWKSDSIQMYGKEIPLPRLTAWYGDPGATYVYSKIVNHPEPWTPELLKLKTKVESLTGKIFNSLLLNYYRDEKDHVSWHRDAEKELGTDPYIASLSLGGTRRFQLKHLYDKSLPTITLELESGSLLLMSENIQHFWIHRIAPTKKAALPRINLTFRSLITGGGLTS